jgi:uncharacterized protein (UPF0147 family)
MEEVVVNKFRKNLLDESLMQNISTIIKDYTFPKNIVRVIEEYREEIKTEYKK